MSSSQSASVSAAKSVAKYDAEFTASIAKSAAASKSVAVTASKTTSVQEKTTTTVQKSEKTATKVDILKEQKKSLEYGKASRSQAVRRAEIHAQTSGKDPRHTLVPRNMDDDICYKIADIHLSPYTGKEVSSANTMGKLKVEKMEKELSALTSSAMSYKSIYAKSAAQLAKEAMEACQSEAASSKKVRKTVVETSSKRVAAA